MMWELLGEGRRLLEDGEWRRQPPGGAREGKASPEAKRPPRRRPARRGGAALRPRERPAPRRARARSPLATRFLSESAARRLHRRAARGRAAACPERRAAVAEREHRRSPGAAPRDCPRREHARAPPRRDHKSSRAPPPLADRDDDPNYNAYVIQAAAFFLIAALGLVWTVCACYECKKFTDCCCPNPECGPCACVECLPGFRPGAAGDSKKTDGAGAVEMTEEV